MKFCLSFILFFVLSLSLSAQYTISGTVANEQGEDLIGASVFLIDTEYATISDENGKFNLGQWSNPYLLRVIQN